MKNLSYILLFGVLLFGGVLTAQSQPKDTVIIGNTRLDDVKIRDKKMTRAERRKYRKQMKKFNKLRYNVLKVWPYANAAAKVLTEIEQEIGSIPEDKREKYLDKKEKELFGEYEKDIRNMTTSQGKILIKLIDRQTGSPTYSLIKDLKSGTSAFFWNAIGSLFGYNLKREFDGEGDDFAVELICRSIENGSNPTYYDYVALKKKVEGN